MTTYVVSGLIEADDFKRTARSFGYRVRLPVDNSEQLYRWAAALNWLCCHHGQPRFRMETHNDHESPVFMPGNEQGAWMQTGLETFAFSNPDTAVLFKLTWGGT